MHSCQCQIDISSDITQIKEWFCQIAAYSNFWNTDIYICEGCKGPVKISSCVEDQLATEKILRHLKEKAISSNSAPLAPENSLRDTFRLEKCKPHIGYRNYSGGT